MLVTTVALVLQACSDDAGDDPAAAPTTQTTTSPTPTPTPSPSPAITPVRGTSTVTAVDSSDPQILGFQADAGATDVDVSGTQQVVVTALDTLLDGAQRGTPTLTPIGADWLDTARPATAAALREDVTNPTNTVAAANYTLTAYVDGPTVALVMAVVTVERMDGTAVTLELGFDVSSGTPELLNIGTPGGA